MPETALAGRVKALIAFRAVFVTVLLGSSLAFKVVYFSAHPRAISYFIVALYSLTIIYSLLITRLKHLLLFTYIQLIIDALAEIILIYITGGVESWFSFTLILTVMSSSIVLNKRAGYVIASISSILYGLLLDFQFYRVLPIPHEALAFEKDYIYNIFIHIISIYLTAFLSGYLSHSLEKTVKKLEEKDLHLRDLELFNIEVIQSLPSGLFTTDLYGNVLIFNKAAEKITCTDKQMVLGKQIDTALPFLPFPFTEGRLEETLDLKEEGKKIIGMTISLFKDAAGNETGYIGIFQDLTQLKTLEHEIKEKEKFATIGELAANIAHEIRNPLAAMRSSIEMLKEEKVPSRHNDKLMDIALNEMGRLNDIITDFLAYSSPKNLDLQRVDLHLLLDETLELLGNADQTGGKVLIVRDFEGQLSIQADSQKLKQVFWNLGVNALQAMQRGGQLTVSTRKKGNRVFIAFTDTGMGIEPAEREKIFFPFFTTKDRGTGLGLSIAYKIVEEHGGKLMVRSVPGIQTTFEIILNGAHGTAQG